MKTFATIARSIAWGLAWAAAIMFLLAALHSAHAAEIVELPIKWVRGDHFPQSEVRDGACVIYAPETARKSRVDTVPIEPLVQACLAQGGLVPGSGDYDLTWTIAANTPELHRLHIAEYGEERRMVSPRAFIKPGRGKTGERVGFARYEGRTCRVWTTAGFPVLGHEIKHCYDGSWHL